MDLKNIDCRHFKGDKPCRFSQNKMCLPFQNQDCPAFEPIEKMTLIIKLGALGDVLRTTTLLPALKKNDPHGSIVWLTSPAAVPLLENSGVYKVLPWNLDSVLWAENVQWNRVISLDKEEGPTTLASRARASRRYGFGRNKHGLLIPLSRASEYLFLLGIDDQEKFRINKKTYPHLIAEACDLEWGPNPYVLNLSEKEINWGNSIIPNSKEHPHIGLNVGSGEAFAGKKWPMENFVKLAQQLTNEGFVPVFLGGAKEKDLYEKLKNEGKAPGLFPGCEFSLREFMAIVSKLKAMVAGDTLAMHIGIALGVWQVTLFGSTTEREIEFYGKGEALVENIPCAPCYKRVCPTKEECMSKISVERVFEAIKRGLNNRW
ncbi:MAG: glycosyltransferase family 9 protein [Candidatus Riflebacteria bacterium]|nr:glycosyltransferase family 9 protein [Candidatus Riflebacteria bacterium]